MELDFAVHLGSFNFKWRCDWLKVSQFKANQKSTNLKRGFYNFLKLKAF
jgi:hypothetical protein